MVGEEGEEEEEEQEEEEEEALFCIFESVVKPFIPVVVPLAKGESKKLFSGEAYNPGDEKADSDAEKATSAADAEAETSTERTADCGEEGEGLLINADAAAGDIEFCVSFPLFLRVDGRGRGRYSIGVTSSDNRIPSEAYKRFESDSTRR